MVVVKIKEGGNTLGIMSSFIAGGEAGLLVLFGFIIIALALLSGYLYLNHGQLPIIGGNPFTAVDCAPLVPECNNAIEQCRAAQDEIGELFDSPPGSVPRSAIIVYNNSCAPGTSPVPPAALPDGRCAMVEVCGVPPAVVNRECGQAATCPTCPQAPECEAADDAPVDTDGQQPGAPEGGQNGNPPGGEAAADNRTGPADEAIPATGCFETDGGRNYSQAGSIYVNGNATVSDFCNDNGGLSEYYCDASGSFRGEIYDCPGACIDGACVGGQAIPDTCKIAGMPCASSTSCCAGLSCSPESWTCYNASAPACLTVGYSCASNADCCLGLLCNAYTNMCYNASSVQACRSPGLSCQNMDDCCSLNCVGGVCAEYACNPGRQCDYWYDCCSNETCSAGVCTSTAPAQTEQTSCSQAGWQCGDYYGNTYPDCCSGLTCLNSYCMNQTAQQTPFTCNDSDNGKTYNTKGTLTTSQGTAISDFCNNAGSLQEYFCIEGGFNSEAYPCTCSNGACAAQTCNDTDGGRNYTVKGTVTKPGAYTQTDSCYNSTRVTEYFCSAGDLLSAETSACEFGCNDGACYAEYTCTESDAGLDYFNRGTITTRGIPQATDYCRNSSTIREFYCTDLHEGYLPSDYNCSLGCSNGACAQFAVVIQS